MQSTPPIHQPKPRFPPRCWTQANGVEVPIEEMDTIHLSNLLRFLQRKVDWLRHPSAEPEKSDHDWLIEHHSHYALFVRELEKRKVNYLVTGADLRGQLEVFRPLKLKVPQFVCKFRFENHELVEARILVPKNTTITHKSDVLIQIHPIRYKDRAAVGELYHIHAFGDYIAQGKVLEIYA